MFRVEGGAKNGDLVRLRMARSLFGRPLFEVSAYRLGPVLIDTGCPASSPSLLAWVAAQEGIEVVINSHHHEDHVGGNARLQHELQLPIYAPAATLPLLAARTKVPVYRRVTWGSPLRSWPLPLADRFDIGDLSFDVVPTPGHAFDHVALFERNRGWLFSGDLYIHPRPVYLRRIEEPWTHLDSLRRVLALEPSRLICSHAGPIENPMDALRERIDSWERLAEAAAALRQRGWSVPRIRRKLLGREGLLAWVSLGDYSKNHLIRGLIGEAAS